MKSISTIIIALCTATSILAGQPSQVILDYIDTYKAIAVREMLDYKIPASITMAQGILESGAGQSELARESNNHFGIKCHSDWTGDKVYYDDDAKDECFRKYDKVEDSYRDHSEFLATRNRYASLFELKPDDYKGWAKGLKTAGYATNPKYADMLIKMIEDYQLYELDKLGKDDLKKLEKDNGTHLTDKEKEEQKEKEPANTNTKEEKKKVHTSWGGYSEQVFYFNRIPTLLAQPGDTPESIAKANHLRVEQFYTYNDMQPGMSVQPGTKIYLQPKRKKGSTKFHTVQSGETMWSISRDEGVRLDKLYAYNKLAPGQEPATGEQIHLRNKIKTAPKLVKQNSEKKKEVPVEKKSDSGNLQQKAEQENQKDEADDIFLDMDAEEEIVPETPGKNEPKQDEILPERPVDTAPAAKMPVYHTVQAKETLYALSKRYGVSVEDLQKWNKLQDNTIQIGQELIVGYQ
ncbi:MAG: LysM peptidoglycan-binding domain-containing protein [Chitinophagales bacterium]